LICHFTFSYFFFFFGMRTVSPSQQGVPNVPHDQGFTYFPLNVYV
jgi:hypothetical protein